MSEQRRSAAIARFDQLNSADPSLDAIDPRPRELVQAERLSRWVERIEPTAGEALTLAARCQHLMRWKLKRSEFPPGRAGYLAWRKQMATFHADEAEIVLRGVGYEDRTIEDVRRIVQKQGMATHADVQTMEDALCLAFIEHELGGFAEGQTEAKVLDILRRTWRKMSPRGRAHAEALLPRLPPAVQALIGAALGGAG